MLEVQFSESELKHQLMIGSNSAGCSVLYLVSACQNYFLNHHSVLGSRLTDHSTLRSKSSIFISSDFSTSVKIQSVIQLVIQVMVV